MIFTRGGVDALKSQTEYFEKEFTDTYKETIESLVKHLGADEFVELLNTNMIGEPSSTRMKEIADTYEP